MRKILLLIVICLLATMFSLVFSENPFIDTLYFSGENLRKGYFWSPITALFIHANMAHLIGNMLFLYAFGSTLESEIGSTRTILAFFIGGVLSFILSLYFYGSNTIMIGSSAAIFTLLAIVMLIKPLKFSWLFLMPLGLVAILYFIYNALMIFYLNINETNIGYLGHVIGFLVGVPFGISWSRGKWKRNLLITIALLTIYFIVINIITEMLGLII
ncbi:MAG: rhomboid family intramembrane serine protease [Candidatus Bathyarchaeia archaeon]|nr:rhomboid family intramembrane serine protease [Candidatus Bathyarchaeota archaeon]